MAPLHYQVGAFPPKPLLWEELIPLLGPASAAVARYDGVLAAIPNADVLLSPLVTQEAVLSSRIEGTQATMGEVLELQQDALLVTRARFVSNKPGSRSPLSSNRLRTPTR